MKNYVHGSHKLQSARIQFEHQKLYETPGYLLWGDYLGFNSIHLKKSDQPSAYKNYLTQLS